MASGQTSKSKANAEWFPGQQAALGDIFAPGGVFSQFTQGKPNVGFERQQQNALDQLKQRQAQSGTLNTPLGTRQQSDFLQQTTASAGDAWFDRLFQFMAPAGTKSTSRSAGGGVL